MSNSTGAEMHPNSSGGGSKSPSREDPFDRKITFTRWQSADSKKGTRVRLSLRDLAKLVKEMFGTTDKKELRAVSTVECGGQRGEVAVQFLHCSAFDIDNKYCDSVGNAIDIDQVANLMRAYNLIGLAHTTTSNKFNYTGSNPLLLPKCRAFFPLKRRIDPKSEEGRLTMRKIRKFGVETFGAERESFVASYLFFIERLKGAKPVQTTLDTTFKGGPINKTTLYIDEVVADDPDPGPEWDWDYKGAHKGDNVVRFPHKFVEVDIDAAGVSARAARLIRNLDGLEDSYSGDGSNAMRGAAIELYKAGLTDAQILSVLTDPANRISEVVAKRRGKDRESQAQWIADYQLPGAKEEVARRQGVFQAEPVEPKAAKQPGKPRKRAEVPWPPAFRGPMAALADAITEGAYKPRPDLSMFVAVSAMAASIGGRYQIDDNHMRLNFYATVLVKSTGGKDNARKIAEEVVGMSGAKVLDRPGSGAALEDQFEDYKNEYMSVDEAGHLYQKLKSGGDSNMVELSAVLLKAFSGSAGAMRTRALASDPENSNRVVWYNCLNVMNYSTISKFAKTMDSMSIEDGTLNRQFFYAANSAIPAKLRVKPFIVPELVVEKVKLLETQNAFTETHIEIQLWDGGEVEEFLTRVNDENNALGDDDSPEAVLRGRFMEKMKRVAGVLAVWDDPKQPKVTVRHLEWAYAFVKASDLVLARFMQKNVHEDKGVADAEKLKAVLERLIHGEVGFKYTDVKGRAKQTVPRSAALMYSKMSAPRFNLALNHLVAEEVVRVSVEKPSTITLRPDRG